MCLIKQYDNDLSLIEKYVRKLFMVNMLFIVTIYFNLSNVCYFRSNYCVLSSKCVANLVSNLVLCGSVKSGHSL